MNTPTYEWNPPAAAVAELASIITESKRVRAVGAILCPVVPARNRTKALIDMIEAARPALAGRAAFWRRQVDDLPKRPPGQCSQQNFPFAVRLRAIADIIISAGIDAQKAIRASLLARAAASEAEMQRAFGDVAVRLTVSTANLDEGIARLEARLRSLPAPSPYSSIDYHVLSAIHPTVDKIIETGRLSDADLIEVIPEALGGGPSVTEDDV